MQVTRFDKVIITCPAEGETGLTIVQADTNQAADLVQIQKADGTILARIDSDGDYIPGSGHAQVLQTKAGIPVDGDYTTPANGMIMVDTTNNKIMVRIGGAWKGVAVA